MKTEALCSSWNHVSDEVSGFDGLLCLCLEVIAKLVILHAE